MAFGVVGALVDRARWRRWLRCSGAVALTYAVNQAIKIAVRRPRPDLPGAGQLSQVETQLSFPSAHAATSLCGARVLRDTGAPGAPLYGLAGALALSRLYLGVHYPSDVVGGAVLGDVIGRWFTR